MKPYSQMVPRIRRERLLAYNTRIRNTRESIQVLNEWELDLERNLIEINGHKLKSEILQFGANREHKYVHSTYCLILYHFCGFSDWFFLPLIFCLLFLIFTC